MPSGKGIADLAYIPKRRSPLPAMLIELKWDKTAQGAIGQIQDKRYPAVLGQYEGDLLLAGVNYDPVSKTHSCRIERIKC